MADRILDITIALDPHEGPMIVLVSSTVFVADEVRRRTVLTLKA